MSERSQLLPTGTSTVQSRSMSFITTLKKVVLLTFYSSPVNYLLIFVPLGLVAEKLGLSSTWVFTLNFFAIIPLASILLFATEELAEQVGETIGGLLNATVGNAVELIVSIIAIQQNQIRVVQLSMLGSILGNLLLVLGCCFIFGGYDRLQQTFNQTVAQTMSSLLALSVIGLLLPLLFHASLPAPPPGSEFPSPGTSDDKILSLSRGTAIILLIVYILYLFFQLKTHKSLFENVDQELETTMSAGDANDLPLSSSSNTTAKADFFDSHLTSFEGVLVLLLSTLMVSFSADLLVGSIDDIVESSGLSKTFIGLIIIPIVGNALEHVTAVVVARKDKMDLAIGVAVGSSIQISLFVTPFMVLIGWIFDKPMSLFFSTYETAVMFVAVFITNYLILDGESNWLEGAMLLSTYIIIAISFFYYPDEIAN